MRASMPEATGATSGGVHPRRWLRRCELCPIAFSRTGEPKEDQPSMGKGQKGGGEGTPQCAPRIVSGGALRTPGNNAHERKLQSLPEPLAALRCRSAAEELVQRCLQLRPERLHLRVRC